MIARDISLGTPQQNILYDEVLFHLAEKEEAGESLRFWESAEMFVVLGRIGKMEDDVHSDAVSQDRIPILRRTSGGGTVLQGPGCLNYSLVLSKDRDVQLNDLRKSYQVILGKVVGALGRIGIEAAMRPISDIAIAGGEKKISGNAQHRGRKYILHHGTLLYQFDLSAIAKYLKTPLEMPEYRQKREHLDFVTNISLDPDHFKQAMRDEFGIVDSKNDLPDRERMVLEEFVREKSVVVAPPRLRSG